MELKGLKERERQRKDTQLSPFISRRAFKGEVSETCCSFLPEKLSFHTSHFPRPSFNNCYTWRANCALPLFKITSPDKFAGQEHIFSLFLHRIPEVRDILIFGPFVRNFPLPRCMAKGSTSEICLVLSLLLLARWIVNSRTVRLKEWFVKARWIIRHRESRSPDGRKVPTGKDGRERERTTENSSFPGEMKFKRL